MLAFHNDPKLKTELLAGLALHAAADEIVKGRYWEDGKGCHIGCSLETIRQIKGFPTIQHDSHAVYEEMIGVPRALAQIADAMFEALPNGHSKAWPERFTSALAVGADLSKVSDRWLLWLLIDPEHGVVNLCGDRPDCEKAVRGMAELFQRRLNDDEPSESEWAAEAAWAARAARAAEAAWAVGAARAAWAAEAAEAAEAAWAAEAARAAWAARAARAARAAWAARAARAARAVGAVGAAEAAEKDRLAIIQAEKLIELIEAVRPA